MLKLGRIVEMAGDASIVHLNNAVGKFITTAVVSHDNYAAVRVNGALTEKLQSFVS